MSYRISSPKGKREIRERERGREREREHISPGDEMRLNNQSINRLFIMLNSLKEAISKTNELSGIISRG